MIIIDNDLIYNGFWKTTTYEKRQIWFHVQNYSLLQLRKDLKLSVYLQDLLCHHPKVLKYKKYGYCLI